MKRGGCSKDARINLGLKRYLVLLQVSVPRLVSCAKVTAGLTSPDERSATKERRILHRGEHRTDKKARNTHV